VLPRPISIACHTRPALCILIDPVDETLIDMASGPVAALGRMPQNQLI
jgi:hypothetical protein